MRTAGKIILALATIGVFLYFFDIRVVDGRVELSRRDDASRARIDRAVGGLSDRGAASPAPAPPPAPAPSRIKPAPAQPAAPAAKPAPAPPAAPAAKPTERTAPHRDVPKSDRRALEALLEEAP